METNDEGVALVVSMTTYASSFELMTASPGDVSVSGLSTKVQLKNGYIAA
jgi:hypothetical protein